MNTNSAELRAANDALLAQGLKRCPHPDCPAKGQPQPVEHFYRKASTRDQLSGWCKACCIRNSARSSAAYRASDAGKATARRAYEKRSAEGRDLIAKAKYRESSTYREWLKDYSARPDRKAAQNAYNVRERAKRGARAVVNNAITEGRLVRASELPCSHCCGQAAEYHHHLGYEPEHVMDVTPLCVECHRLTDLRERVDARITARFRALAVEPHPPSTSEAVTSSQRSIRPLQGDR